jgi:hypothetical protein
LGHVQRTVDRLLAEGERSDGGGLFMHTLFFHSNTPSLPVAKQICNMPTRARQGRAVAEREVRP